VLLLKKLVLITAIFSQIVFAQQNDLTIDLQPVADSKINWETTLTLVASDDVSSGMLIEIPSAIKMVPLGTRINQNEMLLQNKSEVPSTDSVICWDLSKDGIILLFRDGQLNSGDQIIVKAMTTRVKRNLDENAVVNIRSIQNADSPIQYSEDIKSSANLSLKIEN